MSNCVEAVDPDSGESASLYHPRRHVWKDHFQWDDYSVVGLTPVGRATIVVLDLNQSLRLQIRKAEQLFGLFPPEAEVTGS